MKQKLLTTLVLGAISGMAASSAMAGQITASSTNVGREVITTNAQTLVSPVISYRFAGDIDATVQVQQFQVQWTLEQGATWAALPSDDNITITPSVGANVGVVGVGGTDFTVVAKNISGDGRTLWATIDVPVLPAGVWVAGVLDQPIVTVNAGPAVGRATIRNLKSLVGDLVDDFNTRGMCLDNKNLFVNFQHFKLLANPSAIAVDLVNGVADEHVRAGATNRAGIINFPTNVRVNVAASSGGAILTPGGNMTFSAFGAGTSWVDLDTVMLGRFNLSQNATGYDSDLVNQYLLTGNPALSGLTAAPVASLTNGNVEVNTVSTVVSATQGFALGSSLYASTAADCSAPVAGSATGVVTNNTMTVTIPNAAVNATFGPAGTNNVYICYDVPGTTTIPSSAFAGVTRVNKSIAGANMNEQDNICNGGLYSLGGGLKIDIRNYASSAETSGYLSVVRFVNNSDNTIADVWAQIIHQDGKLGKWGKLADLPVRGVLNLTAPQIEAKLTNAATAAVGPNDPVAQPGTPTSSDTAPRLRITSTTGKSLRVQNYLYNAATGQILEGSGSQGVDFEGTILRAPANEGMYQSQDANSGLNLAP